MRVLIVGLQVLLLSLFISGCGGNALEWMADENSTDAKKDKIDFAFVEGNCSYVIMMLEPHVGFLSETELYQYNNAVLACSGFSIVDSINVILDKDAVTANDPFVTIQEFMGTDTLTDEKIAELKGSYDKVLQSCTGTLSEDMQTVCGMTAAAHSVLAVSEVALNLSGADSITASKDGITSAIGGKGLSEISSAVDSSVNSGAISMDGLNNDLALITSASVAISNMAEGNIEFSSDLEKFSNDLKDSSTGTITSSSFSNYIFSQFRDNGGAQ